MITDKGLLVSTGVGCSFDSSFNNTAVPLKIQKPHLKRISFPRITF